MMKRTLTFILALILITALPVCTGAPAASASWADDIMAALIENGVLDAIPEDPAAYITREEFFVMLAKAALLREDATLTSGNWYDTAAVFEDSDKVKTENRSYITYLYQQRIMRGSAAGGKLYILPDSLLTRQDASALLGRWLGMDPQANVNPASLFNDDGTISGYARSIVYQLSGFKVRHACEEHAPFAQALELVPGALDDVEGVISIC